MMGSIFRATASAPTNSNDPAEPLGSAVDVAVDDRGMKRTVDLVLGAVLSVLVLPVVIYNIRQLRKAGTR